jgi:hypothetical protein
MRTIAITVELTVEDDVLVGEAKEYVHDATRGWGGQFDPSDPFFGDNKSVRITAAKIVKKPLTGAKPARRRLGKGEPR